MAGKKIPNEKTWHILPRKCQVKNAHCQIWAVKSVHFRHFEQPMHPQAENVNLNLLMLIPCRIRGIHIE
jgi:hypothetical protein